MICTREATHLPSLKEISWDSKTHTISIGRTIYSLTPTEYRLLFPLRHGTPVAYAELALNVYSCDVDVKVRIMMDKHIDRLRGKLRGSGVYIYCVLGYGYLLLPEIS